MGSKRLYIFQARIILLYFIFSWFDNYLFLFIVVYSPDGIVTAFIPFGITLFLLLLLSYLETLTRPVLTRVSRHVLIKKYLIRFFTLFR